jgi:hypothetical protein
MSIIRRLALAFAIVAFVVPQAEARGRRGCGECGGRERHHRHRGGCGSECGGGCGSYGGCGYGGCGYGAYSPGGYGYYAGEGCGAGCVACGTAMPGPGMAGPGSGPEHVPAPAAR